MGSSSKDGGSGGKQHVSATIACLAGRGPYSSLRKIILNGEVVWEGPIFRDSTTNPVRLTTKYGSGDWFWGTEDQPASTVLNQYEEHPPMKGIAYFVFIDFDHGQNSNAYNAEFIVRGAPDQSVITGDPAETDANFTVNPITAAAEVLTSPAWLGRPASDLIEESFQDVADEVQGEQVDDGARSAWAIAPLWNQAEEIRTVLGSLAAVADAWLRVTPAGKIECGRWRRDSDPPSVTTLTHDDLSEVPEYTPAQADEVPNSFAVEFVDSTALHKEAKITVDDLAGIIEAAETSNGFLRRNTIKAPFVITHDQALRAGQEALRRANAVATWSGQVRYGKAITPEGARLQPGDYIRVPISKPGAAITTVRLLRILKIVRPKNATSSVQIEGTLDRGAIATPTAVSAPSISSQIGSALPPIVYSRVLAVPPVEVGAAAPIHVLACRPVSGALGVTVYYDDSDAGDFPVLGRQNAFSLPVSLVQSFDDAATTIRIALIPEGASGQNFQRDANYLRTWSGGATEARDDELLLILLRKEVDGAITYQAGDVREHVEILSIAGAPTLVGTDTFDVPVLRGRRGTTALNFTAGSFPDVWSGYEGWVIPRSALFAFAHQDFESLRSSGDFGHFRLGAYSALYNYSPEAAFAERDARVSGSIVVGEFADQPDDSTWVPESLVDIPEDYELGQIIDGGEVA